MPTFRSPPEHETLTTPFRSIFRVIDPMNTPPVQALLLPILRACAAAPRAVRSVEDEVAQHFGLTDDDRRFAGPTGRPLFHTRFRNARSYLKHSGLISKERHGTLHITTDGRRVLASGIDEITFEMLGQYPGFVALRHSSKQQAVPTNEVEPPTEQEAADVDPEERLEAAAAELAQALRAHLIEKLRVSDPAFFEKVVVDVMLAMGYGGTHSDAGRRLGRSGDGGVDGVINEDRLGLDRIYLQAKRLAADSTIGRPMVQAFVGALHGQAAHKGVFITTSSFTRDALDYVRGLGNMRVILIDGATLAGLMIDHDVGVRPHRNVTLKRIDLDYFEDGDV